MEQIYQERPYEIKFSSINPNYLGVLSYRDIQIFEQRKDPQPSQVYKAGRTLQSIHGFDEQQQFGQKYKLKVIADFEQIQTFEWSKIKNQLYIIAAHQNGKISLVNVNHKQLQTQQAVGQGFQNTNVVYNGKVEKEFFTRSMLQNYRQCNSLSWNPLEQNIFAAGYEFSKNESSLLIWDINRSVNPNYNKMRDNESSIPNVMSDSTVAKLEQKKMPDILFEPKYSFQKISEDIFSLCWFVDSKTELIYGTDKQIKICDTRDYQNFRTQYDDVSQNQVLGIKFDPFDPRRFATLTEEAIKVFDLRNNKKPFFVIKSQNDNLFGGFDWSLYRSNLLVSYSKKLQKNVVSFWDLYDTEIDQLRKGEKSNSTYDAQQQYIQAMQVKSVPYQQIQVQDDIIGFAWNPKGQQDKDKFYIYTKNGLIEEKTFIEKSVFVVDLSARGQICMSGQQKKTLHSLPFFDSVFDYDRLKNQFLNNEAKESLNGNISSYQEEGTAFADIENQIVNRIKYGYFLESIDRNQQMSLHFRGAMDQYSSGTPLHSLLRGQRALWSWLKKINQNDQYTGFMDGILKQLDISIVDSREGVKQLQLQYGSSQAQMDQSEDILTFKIYNHENRANVIKFCGWTDCNKMIPPQLANPKNASGTNANQQQLQQMLALHNHAVSTDLAKMVTQIEEQEQHIPGIWARISIIGALHFDFHFAMGQSNHSDAQLKYKEEATNIQVLNNILKNLKEIKYCSNEEIQIRLQQLLGFSKGLHTQMKNPYFKAFFGILDRESQQNQNLEDHRINFFDYIAIHCRFLSANDLLSKLQQCIRKGIEEGNLEIITLIGLRSPYVALLLQKYVDKTGDIQTAAYVSAYSFTARQIPKKNIISDNLKDAIPKKETVCVRLMKKFIGEYRNFLNHLQLWYIRAEFDVTFGQLNKMPIFRKFELSLSSRNDMQHINSFQDQLLSSNLHGMDDGDEDDEGLVQQKSLVFTSMEDITKQYQFGFAADPLDKKPYEMSAKCFFCGAQFAVENQVKNYLCTVKVSTNQANAKMISKHCECNKSVPNCAVCLAPIGIMNYQVELQKNKNQIGQENKNIMMRRELENWFLWCQTCKHGGHTQHVLEWFKSQNECPVSNCNCSCSLKSSD